MSKYGQEESRQLNTLEVVLEYDKHLEFIVCDGIEAQSAVLTRYEVEDLIDQLQDWVKEERPSTGTALTLAESEVELTNLRKGVTDLINHYRMMQQNLIVFATSSKSKPTRIESEAKLRVVKGFIYRLRNLYDGPKVGR